MPIRSVSLDDYTAQIAERMPNFSAFVREALESYAAEAGQGVHTQAPANRTHGEKCNPMGKKLCKICWPDGRPSRDDWFHYVQNPNFLITSSQAGKYQQLIEQTFAYNKPEKKSSDAVSNDRDERKVGFLRYLIRRIW
tara:strand:- start:412 stop:825 length:414 start_codon:yes stop_codon:yes gene_type:complete